MNTEAQDPSASAAKPAWRSWVAAGAVGALIVAGGVFVLGRGDGGDGGETVAATGDTTTDTGTGPPGGAGRPGGRGTGGEITDIDGATITLDAEGDTYTVSTSDDTEVSETVDGSVTDITVGDTIVVVGEVADGAVTAESISEGGLGGGFGGPGGPGGGPPEDFEPPGDVELPEGFDPPEDFDPTQGGGPPGGFGGFTNGEVTAVDGSTLTVTTDDDETVTVTVTDETTVTITLERDVDDLEVGDTIQVVGEVEGSNVEATVIRLGELGGFGPGGFGGPPPGTDGSEDAS